MKRFSKWMSTVASSLLALGIICALVGWAMGGQTSMEVTVAGHPMTVDIFGLHSSANTVWTGETSAPTEETLAPFDQLDIDISLGDVNVIPSDHFGLALSWHGKNYELLYENENGTLKVWSTSVPNVGINFGMNYAAKVTVYLPEGGVLSDVTVKTNLGDADLSGFHADKLEVKADLGDISMENVTTKTGTFRLNLGDLSMDRVTADKLDLKLAMGQLNVYGLTTGKELIVENNMGDIVIQGSLGGKTDVDADMGDVSISSDLSDHGYDLDTGMGTVRVNGEDRKDKAKKTDGNNLITVDNGMGDIELDIP